ncbi:putative LPS assembly protein LptD [Candidatus Cardinium hertigii]|uniref:LPS-assembly protein LptD central domain-containing protein n=1 Tax=Candidatus Cardinium hertigii TaxID=247481 RepID=A0A3N2QBK4_9BACT|nr:putative LPS assembly protein LptD [Candidatus Cardinium hertigii]ROT47151.1 hypothetical protein EDM02_04710 [Candidatus Cardinium hertigii]
MTRSYFLRIATLVLLMISDISILLQATEYTYYYHSDSHVSYYYTPETHCWIFPKSCVKKSDQVSAYTKVSKRLFNKDAFWLFTKPSSKKEEDQALAIVKYQAADQIVFDAKKNILSLHGASVLDYDKMKLEAHAVALDVNAHTIHSKGKKDLHNKPIENPIFTYKDIKKDKYGKDGAEKTRIFFMEEIHYNIDTKRALAYKLLTKQEDAIIKSEQVKKEDEETFYAKDVYFTTCTLERPHFYLRTKRSKLVQDKQITTGPFYFSFDDVPTPLGCFFGVLFLEGKRKHGIIPPSEITESSDEDGGKGFCIRNIGYYINFNDYADNSFLLSLYTNLDIEFENKFRYKKKYLCQGNIDYAQNHSGEEKNWSLAWKHIPKTRGNRSLRVEARIHSKGYKKRFDDEGEHKKKSSTEESESTGSLAYTDKLVGLPYTLSANLDYKINHNSNFKHFTLPKGVLSATWHPFKGDKSESGFKAWFHNIKLQHNIDFENHFQNLKKEPRLSEKVNEEDSKALTKVKWNEYREYGINHTLPLNTTGKLFKYFNLTPNFTYKETWYWKRLDWKKRVFKRKESEPMQISGFNRVWSYNFGGSLHTTLYHFQYFSKEQFMQGLRITTTPTMTFTYTPDFSKEKYHYFEETINDKGEKKAEYKFENFKPAHSLMTRAQSVLAFKLENKVHLKVKKEIDSNTKKKQKASRKIVLIKNIDFSTKYDFEEKKRPLDDINIYIASETEMLKIGPVGATAGFGLTTTFDPYHPIASKENDKHTTEKESFDFDFAWNHGGYLGKLIKRKLKINMKLQSTTEEKHKKKALLSDDSELDKIDEKDKKTDFDNSWSFGCDFGMDITRKRLYEKDEIDENAYTKDKYREGDVRYRHNYVNLEVEFTLLKKWKFSLDTSYDFDTRKLKEDDTKFTIARDLHCWLLSYKCYPLKEKRKYEFSLGAKANILKKLKLPRKREFLKLK